MSLPDRVGDLYFSPSFSFGGERWYLEMYPHGRRNKSDGYVAVYLCRKSDGPPVQLNYIFALKTSDDELTEQGGSTQIFEMRRDSYGGCFLRRSRLLRRQSELAPSGHLTFVCRLKHPTFADASSKFFFSFLAIQYTLSDVSVEIHLWVCKPLKIKDNTVLHKLKVFFFFTYQSKKY